MLRPVTVPDSELPVYLGAEAMQSDDERNLTLDGQGVVRRADGVLSGDFLYYKQNTEDVTAIGNARLVQDGNIVIGP